MILIEKILFLKKISIFQSLTSQELRMIAEVLSDEEFASGEVLFNEGELGECMYLLVEGKISIYTGLPPKTKNLAIFEPGDFFGEMGLYDDKPRAASAMARENSRVLVLHKTDFCDLIAEYPPVALGIMKELNQRLRATNLKLTSFEGKFIDKATQLYTREYFNDCMATEFLKSKKDALPLSFLVIRVVMGQRREPDPPSGFLLDQLLCDIGRILTLHQRPTDLVARFAPDKVTVLLAEASRTGAESFLRRVKRDIDKHQIIFTETRHLEIQVQFMIFNFPEDTQERDAMLGLLEKC